MPRYRTIWGRAEGAVVDWASRPSPAALPGAMLRFQFAGGAVVPAISDGSRWLLQGPLANLSPNSGVTVNTNEVTLQTVVIPGGLFTGGAIQLYALFSFTGTAGTRTIRAKYGDQTFVAQAAGTSNNAASLSKRLVSTGASSQLAVPASLNDGLLTSGTIFSSSVDSSVDQNLLVTMQLTSGSDSATLRRLILEVI